MGLISKIKEKFEPDDLPTRLKKDKITYDEALDELSFLVGKLCNNFFQWNEIAYKNIEKYNSDEWYNDALKCIEELENGVHENDSLNRLYLKTHKEIIQDAIGELSYRNNVYLLGAAMMIKGAREELAPIAGVEFDVEDFKKRCVRPEVVAHAEENMSDTAKRLNCAMYLEEGSTAALHIFEIYINAVLNSMVNDEPTCFNEREQLVDENGNIIEFCGDIFAEIKPLDYKGY